MADPIFHVVMHEPEIPNNTGNIGRTCVATGCALHLIRPLGFDTSEKALRRAGLDYWPRLTVTEHDNWQAYLQTSPARQQGVSSSTSDPARKQGVSPTRWFTSGRSGIPLWRAELRPGDHLIFGKETAGLPDSLLRAHESHVITLPMIPSERGLNVSTVVCAVVYEGIRQCVARGDLTLDAAGRLITG